MLVISRKVGDSIVISEDIKITITSISGDKVSIGVEAPKEIKIIRHELLETIEANKASSQETESTDYRSIASLLKMKKR